MSENSFAEGLACGQGMNNYGCGGGFGWGGDWIAIIVLAALFGGGGFGGWGGGGGNVFGEVQRGFDTTGINNKLNGLENGLCDGFYAQNTNLLNTRSTRRTASAARSARLWALTIEWRTI